MPKDCRILIVGPYPREEGMIQNGVQAVTYYLSEGLAACENLEVHVVTSIKGISRVHERRSISGVNVHLIPFFEHFGSITGFVIDSARIRRAINVINPNIVHVHTQTIYPWAALERGYPSVLTPHGVFFKEAELRKGVINRVQSRLGCGYERDALRRAHNIILLNHYLSDCFGNLIKGANLYFINNPIDDRFFNIKGIEERGVILFVGNIIPRKGLLQLAEAALLLQKNGVDFTVWIIGLVNDSNYMKQIMQYLADNGLAERFVFLGQVSEDEIMDRFAHCSMLVLPSFEETAPMVISQAHAAGKPVVASAVGGIPEMIEDGITGYTVKAGNAAELAARISQVLSSDERRIMMGRMSRRVAAERYKLSSVVKKTVDVYHQVINEATSYNKQISM